MAGIEARAPRARGFSFYGRLAAFAFQALEIRTTCG
jgi:hypothetical protein